MYNLVIMNKKQLNTLYHCVYNIQYHLVIVTKYRKKCITKILLNRLRQIFSDLLLKWNCGLLEFNGEEDHVHILMALNPKVQPSVLINNLKTVSSRLVRKEFSDHLKKFYWKPVFWSRTYCLLTCGGAPLSVIKQYIENQNKILEE